MISGVWAILFLSACHLYGQAPLRWEENLEEACRQAAATNRLVLIHFTAPWCVHCHKMDQEVFSHPSVEQVILADYVPVRLNVAHHEVIARRYGVKYLPTDIVIAPDGRLLDRQPGFTERQQYLARLQQIVVEARRPPVMAGQPQPSASSPVVNPGQMARPHETAYAPPAMAAPPAMTVPPAGPNVPSYVAGTPGYAPPSPALGSGALGGGVPSSLNPALASGDSAYSSGPSLTGVTPGGGDPRRNSPAEQSPSGWPGPAMQPGSPAVGATAAAGQPRTASPGDPTMGNPYSEPPIGSFGAPAGNSPVMGASEQALTPGDPTGSPFGLDGFCPVELVEKEQWSVGDVRWGVNHRGCTYLFSGPQQQQRFLQDPDRYSPAASGI
ncbi:MAG: thioredoxin fold domain-containing protein, partial [Pirellulaceae bacterium]|nr:thioredoxin fold domain-containing protein [Pirellulaceae bacterium]